MGQSSCRCGNISVMTTLLLGPSAPVPSFSPAFHSGVNISPCVSPFSLSFSDFGQDDLSDDVCVSKVLQVALVNTPSNHFYTYNPQFPRILHTHSAVPCPPRREPVSCAMTPTPYIHYSVLVSTTVSRMEIGWSVRYCYKK